MYADKGIGNEKVLLFPSFDYACPYLETDISIRVCILYPGRKAVPDRRLLGMKKKVANIYMTDQVITRLLP